MRLIVSGNRSTIGVGYTKVTLLSAGKRGPVGPAGTGAPGASAYEVAVAAGFVGDEAAWLQSLQGVDGNSAYAVATANGFVGTEIQWLASLNGSDGDSAYAVAVANGFIGDEAAWLASLQGVGVDGLTAYEVAVTEGFVGDETAWLASLKGEPGDPGPVNGYTGWTELVLAADFTAINSTPVATPLEFTPEPNAIYVVDAKLLIQTNATSGGIRTGLNWPTSGVTKGVAFGSTSTAATASASGFTQFPTPLAVAPAGHAIADVPYRGIIDAHFVTGPSVVGNIVLTLSSENGSTVGTMLAGSVLRYRRIQ